MKRIFALCLFFLLSARLHAQFEGYHIQFTLEDINGKVSKGFCYVTASDLDTDSLQNSEYLIKTLGYQIKLDADSFYYHMARLTYNYQNLYDSLTVENKIYALIEKNVIPVVSIKTIKIDEIFDFGYSTTIVNELKIADTSWVKKPVVDIFVTTGYLCNYKIIVHENSKKVELLKHQLSVKQQEYYSQQDYELTDVFYEWLMKYDREVFAIVKQLNSCKVIIISLCRS